IDNGDLISIINGNAQCDEMGIDTISFGVTLAFVAECAENGIVDMKDLDRSVRFGHWPHLSELVRDTAMKTGLGDLLARGSRELAEIFGKGAEKLLYCQQGLEMAGHSARGLRNMGLAYATSTRGGSHHDARPNYVTDNAESGFNEQPEYCFHSQNNTVIGDSLVICRFIQERILGTRLNDAYLPLLQHITGWDITVDELEKIADRIYTLERVINVKRGVQRSSAMLPWRVMNEPIPDGPSQGRCCPRSELEKMLSTYYALRGWDEDGIPTREKLRELGIE
ncbi:MAG: aldehyde ferredoxin oxidoreductase C-terminal domain-containing protein, partial [Desulfomonilia bacterium]|nr:aldehyde ferredoxin oxidoreductase C-terminal domain-containing protein [Desulfomonilia bacterium]